MSKHTKEPWSVAEEAFGNDGIHETVIRGLDGRAALVAAAEREECAALCDRFQARDVGMQPAECAAAIRACGKKGQS